MKLTLTKWRYKGWIQFRRIGTRNTLDYWAAGAEMTRLPAITELPRNGSIKTPQSLTQQASQIAALD